MACRRGGEMRGREDQGGGGLAGEPGETIASRPDAGAISAKAATAAAREPAVVPSAAGRARFESQLMSAIVVKTDQWWSRIVRLS